MTAQERLEAAILVADVTASVELYERLGDAAAFAQIAHALDRTRLEAERHGGRFVQQRGDDALLIFRSATLAAQAAEAMLSAIGSAQLHLGLHQGAMIRARDTVFGDAVNVAYRLAALATAGEALVSGAAAAALTKQSRASLRRLPAFRLKGREAEVEVYSLGPEEIAPMTVLPAAFISPPRDLALMVDFEGQTWSLAEGESLSLGRSVEADLVLDRPWVSRRHAVVMLRDGTPVLVDRSSYGTYVATGEGETRVRRTTAPLLGVGLISPGLPAAAPDALVLRYRVATLEAGAAPV